MKIGIITFHWATNYGAVIQAYALQQYLMSKYPHDTIDIINYIPVMPKRFLSCLKTIMPHRIVSNIRTMIKEKKINNFRQKYLVLSKEYNSYEELKKDNSYDVIICGSDQIWNPWFTQNGEGKQTLSYFLGFCDCIKIAYAASFGCTVYPQELQSIVKLQLENFSAISVREASAGEILTSMGMNNYSVVSDPSVLIDTELYDKIAKTGHAAHTATSMFLLRKQPKLILKFLIEIKKQASNPINSIDYRSIPDWLCAIKSTDMLITNSFHALMICLIYHTSFMIVLEKGAYEGMNDRFVTILNMLCLETRIATEYTIAEYRRICSAKIDWDDVDKKLDYYTNYSKEFLHEALS